MLNVEQVRLLEERVQRVISRTAELQRENGDLRERLEGYQERIRELEAYVETFVSTQAEIEKGVLNALHQLDEVEDAVVEGVQEDRVVTKEDESDAGRKNEVRDSSTPDDLTETTREEQEVPESSTTQEPRPDHVSEEIVSDTNEDSGNRDAPTETEDDRSADNEEHSGPELDIF